jgi:lysozyme family protein
MILQSALGVHVDGGVGPQTLAAERQAEADPAGFLQRLRQAREQYEDQHVGYRANLHAGLVNRWNNALQHSRDILQAQPAGQ